MTHDERLDLFQRCKRAGFDDAGARDFVEGAEAEEIEAARRAALAAVATRLSAQLEAAGLGCLVGPGDLADLAALEGAADGT